MLSLKVTFFAIKRVISRLYRLSAHAHTHSETWMHAEVIISSQLSYNSHCLLGYLNIFQTLKTWNMASNQKFDVWWTRKRGGRLRIKTSPNIWLADLPRRNVAQCNHSLSHFAASPSNPRLGASLNVPKLLHIGSFCDIYLLICIFHISHCRGCRLSNLSPFLCTSLSLPQMTVKGSRL